jgi:large subunit ribosomal protein L24
MAKTNKNNLNKRVKLKIKKGDHVRVIAGDDKGAEGRVLMVLPKENRVIVEGVNVIIKHSKPSAAHPQGGRIEQEAPIHISNVMLLVNNTPTRVGRKRDENGKLVRYAKKTGEVIK